MILNDPTCTICHGKGWFETGLYQTEYDPQPCPHCNPVRPLRSVDIALIVVLLGSLICLVAWMSR